MILTPQDLQNIWNWITLTMGFDPSTAIVVFVAFLGAVLGWTL